VSHVGRITSPLPVGLRPVAAVRAPAPIAPAGSPQAGAALASVAASRMRDDRQGHDPARGRLIDVDA
jgi:hypothetical protein